MLGSCRLAGVLVRPALALVALNRTCGAGARGSSDGDRASGEAQAGPKVSTVDTAHPLSVPGDASAWFVPAGSRRERPGRGAIEVVSGDGLWVAVPGEWWILCGYMDATRSLHGYKVHASAPFEAPRGDDERPQRACRR
jgi:hypothetical protein